MSALVRWPDGAEITVTFGVVDGAPAWRDLARAVARTTIFSGMGRFADLDAALAARIAAKLGGAVARADPPARHPAAVGRCYDQPAEAADA